MLQTGLRYMDSKQASIIACLLLVHCDQSLLSRQGCMEVLACSGSMLWLATTHATNSCKVSGARAWPIAVKLTSRAQVLSHASASLHISPQTLHTSCQLRLHMHINDLDGLIMSCMRVTPVLRPASNAVQDTTRSAASAEDAHQG